MCVLLCLGVFVGVGGLGGEDLGVNWDIVAPATDER